jgi:N-acetyl-anhydromuramyl-L-alanine amidase AmpD
VFEKKWRDYFFWQPYTEEQIQSTYSLCDKLLKEMKIKLQIVEHNTKITGIEKFMGVDSKSNFDTNYTDLSPAFNFNELLKNIKK